MAGERGCPTPEEIKTTEYLSKLTLSQLLDLVNLIMEEIELRFLSEK